MLLYYFQNSQLDSYTWQAISTKIYLGHEMSYTMNIRETSISSSALDDDGLFGVYILRQKEDQNKSPLFGTWLCHTHNWGGSLSSSGFLYLSIILQLSSHHRRDNDSLSKTLPLQSSSCTRSWLFYLCASYNSICSSRFITKLRVAAVTI